MRGFPLILFIAFVTSIGAGQTQPPPAQTQKITNVIEGVILNEITKEPLRRVEVRLVGTLDGGPTGITGTPPPESTTAATTDAQGRFRFENVAPGRYRIVYQRQGFIGQAGGLGGMGMPGSDFIVVTSALELIRFRYTLTPQAILAGRVLDEDGEPVQGAQVMVLTKRFQNGRRQWVRFGGGQPSDDRGEFRVPNIPPGKVVLAVQPGMSPFGFNMPGRMVRAAPETAPVITYYPKAVTLEQATPIEVKAGAEIANLDVRIQRSKVYSIRGKALGVDGGPLEGFYVSLQPVDEPPMPFPQGRFMQRQNGEFEIASVTNGSYIMSLQFRQPGSEQSSFASERIEISGKDVDGITIQARRGARVSGFVAFEGPGEKPQLGGNRVSLVPVEQRMMSSSGMPLPTKDDGSFILTNVPPGRYQLQSFGPVMNGTYRAGTVVNGKTTRGNIIEVSGTDLNDVRILYRKDGGSIRGTVAGLSSSDNGGQPMIAVMLPLDKELVQYASSGEMVAMISRAGIFQFMNVPPGEYRLWAFRNYESGALLDPEIYQKVESQAARVTIRPNEGAAVTVKAANLPLE